MQDLTGYDHFDTPTNDHFENPTNDLAVLLCCVHPRQSCQELKPTVTQILKAETSSKVKD